MSACGRFLPPLERAICLAGQQRPACVALTVAFICDRGNFALILLDWYTVQVALTSGSWPG